MCSVVSSYLPTYNLSLGSFYCGREEAKERGLTRDLIHSCVLQNRGSCRAGQFRAQDLRGCHGEPDAQEDTDGEAAGAYDSDGKGNDGGIGGGSEESAGAALPSGACDSEEGKW